MANAVVTTAVTYEGKGGGPGPGEAFGTIATDAGDYTAGGLVVNLTSKLKTSKQLLDIRFEHVAGYVLKGDLGSSPATVKCLIFEQDAGAALAEITGAMPAALQTGIRFRATYKRNI
jgi:hypothetical protein